MDWTSVFEEDGDETFLIQQQLTAMVQQKQPRMARMVSILYHHQNVDDEGDDHSSEVQEGGEVVVDAEDAGIGGHRLFQMVSSSSSFGSLHKFYRRNTGTSQGAHSQQESVIVNIESSSNPAYTLQALYYLSINYILGVGCLGIPYAFARAGFLLCTAILLVVSFSSFCTVMWVAETGERYRTNCQEQRRRDAVRQQSANNNASNGGDGDRKDEHGEGSPLLVASSASSANGLVDIDDQHHHQHWDRYEVVDLVGFYLGPIHKLLYQISLMALMTIGLLAYSQVFCSALTQLLWDPNTKASTAGIPQLLFAVMVIPLSCFELDEQISVQSLMAAIRFVAIFIMIFGSVLSLLLDDSNSNPDSDGVDALLGGDLQDQPHGPPYWAPEDTESCQMSYTYCFEGFGVAFSTSLFSQLFQHSIPGLLRPLRDKPSKIKKVPKTLAASLLTTLSFYLLLGTSAASFFGSNTKSSVNLNFADFTMGFDADNTSIYVLAAVRFAANIVVIFPALDTISVFPLIANTLGNNLCAAAVGPKTIKWVAQSLHRYYNVMERIRKTLMQQNTNQRIERSISFCHLSRDERKLLFARASRVTTLFWRLVAALPPLLGSLVAADLSFSLLLAGVAGVYVAFFAPSLMQLTSISHSSSNPKTIFQGWYSTSYLCYPVLGFATFSLGAVLVQVKAACVEVMQS